VKKDTEILFGNGAQKVLQIQSRLYEVIEMCEGSPIDTTGALTTVLASYLMAIKQEQPAVADKLLAGVYRILKNVES
jgi:hypothetical protein